MYYKKIVGNKLYLSPIDLDHEVKIMTKWLNEDEEIAYYNVFYHSLLGEDKVLEMMQKWNEGPYTFAMVNKEDDAFMGHITLFNLDSRYHFATMGIYLGKDYRGKGYGKEAIQLLKEFAFNYIGLKALHLEVFAYNNHAYDVYKSLGFKECGRWSKVRFFNGLYHDVILMECLKD